MNCRRSTFAYELRRRGYDVVATTAVRGTGQSESGFINAITPGSKNFISTLSVTESIQRSAMMGVSRSGRATGDTRESPVKKILVKTASDAISPSRGVFDELKKQPNGARGEVLFNFSQFGHSMAYEIVNGVPHIFDSQKGVTHSLSDTVEGKWGHFSAAEITRLDNVDLDISFLTRWATNRG